MNTYKRNIVKIGVKSKSSILQIHYWERGERKMTTSEKLYKLAENIRECAEQYVGIQVKENKNVSDLFCCTQELFHIAEVTEAISLKEKRIENLNGWGDELK